MDPLVIELLHHHLVFRQQASNPLHPLYLIFPERLDLGKPRIYEWWEKLRDGVGLILATHPSALILRKSPSIPHRAYPCIVQL